MIITTTMALNNQPISLIGHGDVGSLYAVVVMMQGSSMYRRANRGFDTRRSVVNRQRPLALREPILHNTP
jgi:hypothetical protein